ncbi:MAG TPA: sugar transferase, partial [Candidatus Sulfotelmatobacter sp.]|nr:sugar transferase [Candidatus Sulfotelmatobacter sp.]
PQLWNVLRGEMSLVGPRPEMPQLVQEYREVQRERLAVKPGITGLWQISADRAFRIHDNMQYDLYYIEHRGLTLDLAILMMTPFVMMARDRAL